MPEENVGRGKKGAAEEKGKPKPNFTTEEHREHIFGIHVQEYFDLLKGENPAQHKKQFSRWIKALGGKSFEDVYTAAHAAIRANPDRKKKAGAKAPVRKTVEQGPQWVFQNSKGKKWMRMHKIGQAARRARVEAKMATLFNDL